MTRVPGSVASPQRPHPKTEIEGAGMKEHSLEHVLVPAHMHAPKTAGLVEMRARSLQQLAARAEEPFPAVAADPASICIDRVAFRLLIDPRLWPAIRFADVGANLQRLEIVD